MLISVVVPLKHVSMRADVCFDAATEGATGGRQTSIPPVVVAKRRAGTPEGYPGLPSIRHPTASVRDFYEQLLRLLMQLRSLAGSLPGLQGALRLPTQAPGFQPPISAAISDGACRNPRLTISVVAPVGGCEEFRRRSTAPVSARESEAVPIRAGVTFSTWMLGSSSRPKTASEKAPAPTATACPIRVLRGLDVAAIGRSKNRRAVGRREGKRSGCLAT